MKIINVEQSSSEWLDARAGRITASEAKNILTPKFAKKESKAVNSYLGRKLAEKWLGHALPDEEINSVPVEWGKILEMEARPTLNCVYGYQFKRAGIAISDDDFCACSPDGLEENRGCEIKCPLIQTHCKWSLSDEVPEDHIVQVHFSMFVTGFPSWIFMSYRRNDVPPFIIEVKRDEEIIQKIQEAVDAFKERMDAGWQRLIQRNDGLPPKRQKTVDELAAEEIDLTP